MRLAAILDVLEPCAPNLLMSIYGFDMLLYSSPRQIPALFVAPGKEKWFYGALAHSR